MSDMANELTKRFAASEKKRAHLPPEDEIIKSMNWLYPGFLDSLMLRAVQAARHGWRPMMTRVREGIGETETDSDMAIAASMLGKEQS